MKSNRKRSGVSTLISDKIHFAPQIVTRDKDVHVIVQTGLIHLGDTLIINIISLNNRTSTCMKETQN